MIAAMPFDSVRMLHCKNAPNKQTNKQTKVTTEGKNFTCQSVPMSKQSVIIDVKQEIFRLS